MQATQMEEITVVTFTVQRPEPLDEVERAAAALRGRRSADKAERCATRPTLSQTSAARRNVFFAPSLSQPLLARALQIVTDDEGTLWVACTCPAAEFGPRMPVPCHHAASVALALESAGLVVDDGGIWRLPRSWERPRDAHGRFVKRPEAPALLMGLLG